MTDLHAETARLLALEDALSCYDGDIILAISEWQAGQFDMTAHIRALDARVRELEVGIADVAAHMRNKSDGVVRLGIRDNDRSRAALDRLFRLASIHPNSQQRTGERQ